MGDDLFPWPRATITAASKKRPAGVSKQDVAKAVQQAVSRATAQNSDFAQEGNVSGKFEIIGRVVTGLDPVHALNLAESVSRALPKTEPAVAKIGKKILVGFIERGPTGSTE